MFFERKGRNKFVKSRYCYGIVNRDYSKMVFYMIGCLL